MRVISQIYTQYNDDANSISLLNDYSAGETLGLDGVLFSVLPWNGVSVIDMSAAGPMFHTIGFTTGLTGSVADVTIVGLDTQGNAQTEVATMPGASDIVDSLLPFSYISSMTIDGAATNLQVGIRTEATSLAYGPWVPWDTYANPFEGFVQVDKVGTMNYTLQHTVQADFLRSANTEPDDFFDDSAMAAKTVTSSATLTTPIVASRIKLNSGSVGSTLAIKFIQSGGGFR